MPNLVAVIPPFGGNDGYVGFPDRKNFLLPNPGKRIAT